MADTKLSALTENSIPDTSDFLLWLDDTGPTSYKLSILRAFGLFLRGQMQGRLTTETGVPVSTTDRLAQSTLYWTPMDAGVISVFDGTRWWGKFQAELSLALTGLTSGKNYDAFIDYNAGTPALVLGPAWTDNITRATGLTTQNGINVLSGTTTSRWVGTIRTTGTTTTEDSGGYTGTTQVGGKRFVWNKYNQVERPLKVIDTADSWSYLTNTWRIANGATGPLNAVEYVTGDAKLSVRARVLSTVSLNTNTRGAWVGVGVDSATAPSGLRQQAFNAPTTGFNGPITAEYADSPGLGYHYLAWLEKGADGFSTFMGDNAGDGTQSGLIATVLG